MSQFDPRGGGQQFSKMSEIQKSLKYPRGGGEAYLGIFPKFFRFFFMMAPLTYRVSKNVTFENIVILGQYPKYP